MDRFRYRLSKGALGFAPAALAVLIACTSASAGDFSHECRSADGRYLVTGGGLEVSDGAGRTGGKTLDYRVVKEQVLAEREGYCTGPDGQRFGFNFKRSVQRLAFRESGRRTEATVMCEIASSGVPAAYSCGRNVVTRRYEANISQPAQRMTARMAEADGYKASQWRMGPSRMLLYAKGAERILVFDRPAGRAADAGARAGDVAFRGQRDRNLYTGQLYQFAAGCGVRSDYVEGRIGADQTTVTFTGDVALVDRDCRIGAPEKRSVTMTFAGR